MRRGTSTQAGETSEVDDIEAARLIESTDDPPSPSEPGQQEAAYDAEKRLDAPRESETNAAGKAFWLSAWFMNNLGVTLLNKWAFAKVDFPYPYFLSAVHMFCNATGAFCYLALDSEERSKMKSLGSRGFRTIVAFSIIFSANIAIGNASLRHVTVNFNQVLRSLVPAVVMVASSIFLKKAYSNAQKVALLPVVGGIMLACAGEMHYTYVGFAMTWLCVLLAATKVVASNVVLTGPLKLQPMDLLTKLCPLATAELIALSFLAGEVSSIQESWADISASNAAPVVLLSGVLSFSLNITSFYANKVTSPLTLSVAANAKQATLIGLATVIFGTPINALNGLGIIMVLTGSAWYSHVGYLESQAAARSSSKG